MIHAVNEDRIPYYTVKSREGSAHGRVICACVSDFIAKEGNLIGSIILCSMRKRRVGGRPQSFRGWGTLPPVVIYAAGQERTWKSFAYILLAPRPQKKKLRIYIVLSSLLDFPLWPKKKRRKKSRSECFKEKKNIWKREKEPQKHGRRFLQIFQSFQAGPSDKSWMLASSVGGKDKTRSEESGETTEEIYTRSCLTLFIPPRARRSIYIQSLFPCRPLLFSHQKRKKNSSSSSRQHIDTAFPIYILMGMYIHKVECWWSIRIRQSAASPKLLSLARRFTLSAPNIYKRPPGWAKRR